MQMSRRMFLGTAGAGVAATTIGAFGFGGAEAALAGASVSTAGMSDAVPTRCAFAFQPCAFAA